MMHVKSPNIGEPRTVVIDSGGVSGHALATWLVSQGHQAAQVTVNESVAAVAAGGATTALIETAVLSRHEVEGCVAALRAAAPNVIIVLLADGSNLAQSVDWTRHCAADGILSADIAPSRLARLLGSPAPRQGLSKYWEGEASAPERSVMRGSPLDRLTRREREVLAYVSDGATTEAIAETLGISVNTVRTHVQNMLNKLGVRSRLELAAIGRKSETQQLTQAA